MDDQQLIALVTRIAQTALQPLPSSANDQARIAAVKAALDEGAEDGTFGQWGVLSRDQLKSLKIDGAFDARAIAAQIYKIGAFD
jgi:hypothetical protein